MNDAERWNTHRRYVYILAKVALAAVVLTVAWFVFEQLSDVLINIGISFLVAYLLDPLVDWFEARGINRTVAIFLLMVVGLGLLVAAFFIFAPTIVNEFSEVAQKTLPNLVDTARERYQSTSEWLHARTGFGLPKTFNETFSSYGQKLQDVATDVVQRITSVTGEFLSASWAVIAYLVNVAIIPLFVFYYLRDFDKMTAFMATLIPLPMRDRVLTKVRRVDTVVGDWFRGQMTVCAILGTLYGIGLTALDVKLGLVIGILAGLLHLIPYLGFVVGLILALVMSAVDGTSGWIQFFGVIILFVSVQTAESYFITPKIVGERVGLSPLMVIVVLLIGAKLFGFWGVLLAVPAAGVVRVFVLDAIAEYKRSRLFLGEDNFLRLLARGPNGVGEDVREALRQAAESDLDVPLPALPSREELERRSYVLIAGTGDLADPGEPAPEPSAPAAADPIPPVPTDDGPV